MTDRNTDSAAGRPLPSQDRHAQFEVRAIDLRTEPATDDVWVTVRRAEAATGVSAATIRNWARKGKIGSRMVDGPGGSSRVVDLRTVIDRGRALGRLAATPPRSQATAPVAAVAPEGHMLVPLDAWERLLMQLGNLHEAGQQLAEARERAAKAETEAGFLRERLSEIRAERDRLAAQTPAPAPEPTPVPVPTEPSRRPSWLHLVRLLRTRNRW